MSVNWSAPAVDWQDVEGNPSQAKVTTLHWAATLEDQGFTAHAYGATADDQNRVYTKPALESVPEATVVEWIHQALGAEEVQAVENRLADSIADQANPTSGTVNPQ